MGNTDQERRGGAEEYERGKEHSGQKKAEERQKAKERHMCV